MNCVFISYEVTETNTEFISTKFKGMKPELCDVGSSTIYVINKHRKSEKWPVE